MRNRTRADFAVPAIAGAISAAMKAFAIKHRSDCGHPADEMYDSWNRDGIRSINSDQTDECLAPRKDQVIQSFGSNTRTTFTGPA